MVMAPKPGLTMLLAEFLGSRVSMETVLQPWLGRMVIAPKPGPLPGPPMAAGLD